MERDEAWLARKTGYDLSYVWRINRGQRAITAAYVERVCAVLNLPPHLLFNADDRSRARAEVA
jgi:transcriptional regulator with XRE-family HTH domain